MGKQLTMKEVYRRVVDSRLPQECFHQLEQRVTAKWSVAASTRGMWPSHNPLSGRAGVFRRRYHASLASAGSGGAHDTLAGARGLSSLRHKGFAGRGAAFLGRHNGLAGIHVFCAAGNRALVAAATPCCAVTNPLRGRRETLARPASCSGSVKLLLLAASRLRRRFFASCRPQEGFDLRVISWACRHARRPDGPIPGPPGMRLAPAGRAVAPGGTRVARPGEDVRTHTSFPPVGATPGSPGSGGAPGGRGAEAGGPSGAPAGFAHGSPV